MTKPGLFKNPLLISILAITAISTALFFYRLGERSFRNPDEGRYATIAKEMVQSNDWIRPTLFGIPYLRKPILFYWLVAGSFRVFGFHEFAARLVPALFGVAAILVTFLFARLFLGLRIAWMASLILLTNAWFLQVGRFLVIDMVFSFFVTGAIFAFYCGWRSDRRYYNLMYLCIAFAALSKGVLGILLPLVAILLYLVASRRLWHGLATLRIWRGLFIMGIVVVPWFYAIGTREKDFWNVFFVREHWRRAFAAQFEHQEPWFFYPLVLLGILLPWSILSPVWKHLKASFKGKAEDAALTRYLGLCVVSIIAVLSLSKGKLATYLLPIIPFCAILLAGSLTAWCQNAEKAPAKKILSDRLPVILVLGILLFASILFLLSWPKLFQYYGIQIEPVLGPSLCLAAAVILASSVWAIKTFKRMEYRRFIYSQIVMLAALSISVCQAMESMNYLFTTKNYAKMLTTAADPDLRDIFIEGTPGAFYDLGFYSEKRPKLVGLKGEFEEMTPSEQTRGRSISSETFLGMIEKREPIACLMRKSDYLVLHPDIRAQLRILREDERKILVRVKASSGLK